MSTEVLDDPLVKLDDGRWAATVDLGDGSQPQKFYGETREQVVKELIKAQTHATRTIRENKRLLKTQRPDPAHNLPEFKAQPLSADKRFEISQRITDPVSGQDALREAIEAEFGAPIEQIRQTLNTSQELIERNRVMAEASAFQAAHPDYKPCPENEQVILDYLRNRDMGFTAKNLSIAFDDLKDVLIPVTPVVIRPRSASTGLPAAGGASSRAAATPAGPTVEEINRMSTDEYKRRLADPKFAEAVNRLYAPKSPRS